ncbi:DUF362 domain-containing protein [Candidatus Poribacteria bacterium]|nr:DUF362 domain-containing protein [Candidatus Poribacteria bacterium]
MYRPVPYFSLGILFIMKFDENRRDFLKKSIGAGLSLYGITQFSLPILGTAEAKSTKPSVVIARDEKVIDKRFQIDPAVVRKMLDDSVIKLTGTKKAVDAWRELFRSDDIVGIKVNTLSGRRMSSSLEIVYAIVEGLKSAGVKEKNIIIWDKSDRDLESAGFQLNRKANNDPRCYGTIPPIGYEKDIKMLGSIASRLSRIVSHCTAFVNVPVLKHHTMAGVTLSLKNWFGAINNPNKYHFDTSVEKKMVAGCNYIPDVNSLLFSSSGLDKKQPLIVCDALMAQYDMGPGYNPRRTWIYGGLMVARDPVALDRIGLEIIENKRREAGFDSLMGTDIQPDYISIAADNFHDLGIDKRDDIKLINAGNLEPELL